MPVRTIYNAKSSFSNMYPSILPKTVTSTPQSRNQINSNNWVKGNLTAPNTVKRVYFYAKQPYFVGYTTQSGNCNGAGGSPRCCESGYCCNSYCSPTVCGASFWCTSWCAQPANSCPHPLSPTCPGTS